MQGSPSNETSNESDIGKYQDTTAVPGYDADTVEEVINLLPTGVFTLLTDCYSPTYYRNRSYYNITCSRRLAEPSEHETATAGP